MAVFDRIRKAIFRRRTAYRHTFMPGGNMTVATSDVLTDLRRFCRGTATPAVVSPITQTIDPVGTGIAIGRQEVWHRICQHLHVSDSDLYRLVDREEDGTE